MTDAPSAIYKETRRTFTRRMQIAVGLLVMAVGFATVHIVRHVLAS